MDKKIVKIIQVKSRKRITLPKEAIDYLGVEEGGHIVILNEGKSLKITKAKLDFEE